MSLQVRADDDDWTGLTDPKERRKRQNRLHARAWRKWQPQSCFSTMTAGVLMLI